MYVTSDEQAAIAEETRRIYQDSVSDAGHATITTEVQPGGPFYFARTTPAVFAQGSERLLQPGGTGVSCPIGVATLDD